MLERINRLKNYFYSLNKPAREYFFRNFRDSVLSGAKSEEKIRNEGTQISILIPSVSKDVSTLQCAIDSLVSYSLNPINSIYLVIPEQDLNEFNHFPTSVKIISESDFISIDKATINYLVNGRDRSGWLLQQFIKLSSDQLDGPEHVLVWDADTVLNKPTCFVNTQQTQFFFSDEYHLPYFKTLKSLFPEIDPLPVSLVSHHMLFSRSVLREMKEAIEKSSGTDWITAILNLKDSQEQSYFSEYELYGNYFFHTRRKKAKLAYWFNEVYPSPEPEHAMSNARFISYHAYLRP